MTEATVKEKVLKAVSELPADATFEDAMERLYVLYKVEQGLRQIEAGEGILYIVSGEEEGEEVTVLTCFTPQCHSAANQTSLETEDRCDPTLDG